MLEDFVRKPLKISQKTIDRFWRKVEVCSHGKTCTKCCWEWRGLRKSRTYYGLFDLPAIGKKQRAHRVVWILEVLYHFPIPEGVFILHNCDNPPCVNFHHLREGNHISNMADKIERERWGKRVGDNLSSEGAATIRKMYLSGCCTIVELSDLCQVNAISVSAILRQKTHREVRDGLQLFIDQMRHNRRLPTGKRTR